MVNNSKRELTKLPLWNLMLSPEILCYLLKSYVNKRKPWRNLHDLNVPRLRLYKVQYGRIRAPVGPMAHGRGARYDLNPPLLGTPSLFAGLTITINRAPCVESVHIVCWTDQKPTDNPCKIHNKLANLGLKWEKQIFPYDLKNQSNESINCWLCTINVILRNIQIMLSNCENRSEFFIIP